MNATEVKKELYKSKVTAKLMDVTEGKMFYSVQLEDGTYRFPIDQVKEVGGPLYKLEAKTQTSPNVGLTYTKVEEKCHTLSSDLGKTSFYPEMKASELNRWIEKAIAEDEFVKLF